MKITVSKEFFKLTGPAPLWRQLGVEERGFGYGGTMDLDLSRVNSKDGQALLALHIKHPKAPKVRGATQDLKVWVKAVSGAGAGLVPKNVRQFETLVRELIRRTPGQRVFIKDHSGWWCYYVLSTGYSPPKGSGENYQAPYATLRLRYQEFGGGGSESVTFYARDCLRVSPEESLRARGVYLETPELRERYLAQLAHFDSLNGKLGLQCNVVGTGESLEGESWRRSEVYFGQEEGPSRVVIDVFSEGKERAKEAERITVDFWLTGKVPGAEEPDPDDDDDSEEEVEEEEDLPEGAGLSAPPPPPQDPEVPWHPMLAVFDLQRHQRIKVHADNLRVYEYDTKLGEKLVLPVDIQAFITMLTSYTGTFTDIIKGKGSGVAVTLAGPAGTGKTLCAQVYSEVLKKPLYSVQASQLGLDAEELEKNILIAFARAQRWNAILLIDEADVYVSARGSDLVQNAIVGVFLRVMEYYDGVLFLTTNRADLIDDAIASRCVAKIEFRPPEPEGQIKLWQVLSEVMGMTATPADIAAIVKAHPKLTGRDIKNLLKLLKLVTPPGVASSPVTLQRVNFVKAFKPTS